MLKIEDFRQVENVIDETRGFGEVEICGFAPANNRINDSTVVSVES